MKRNFQKGNKKACDPTHSKNEVISDLHICRTDRMSKKALRQLKTEQTAREKPSFILVITHNHSFQGRDRDPQTEL